MSLAPTLYYVLWLLEPLLLALTAGVILRRGLQRKYPFFFAYTLFRIFGFLLPFLLLELYGFRSLAYFLGYWVIEALTVIFDFVVIYAIFNSLSAPYSTLRDAALPLFRWAGAFILLLAAMAALFLAIKEPSKLTAALFLAERTFRIVQAGLLLVLLFAVWYLGLSFKDRAVGIGLGFGIYAAVELAIWATRLQAGRVAYSPTGLLKAAGNLAAIGLWLIYMAQPEPELKPLPALPKADMQEWNAALRELIRR